jgi:hypothetical protein
LAQEQERVVALEVGHSSGGLIMFSAHNPFGCDSMTSVRGVAAASNSEGSPQPALQMGPESQLFQNGVEVLCDHTVVSRFWVCVVDRMMSGSLENPEILEKIYPRAILTPTAVGPLVDLVCVTDQAGEDPDGRCEGFQGPCAEDEECRHKP